MKHHADFLERWHRVVFGRDFDELGRLLDGDIQFRSPAFWHPKVGKAAAYAILTTVVDVFEDFTYQRQFQNGPDWCLEFSAKIKGLDLKGVDLIRLGEAGTITHFEVMVRPANALAALGKEMSQRLNLASQRP